MNTKITGDKGESLAMKYLNNKGYFILEKNWRFKRYEIDIIATIEKTLVFIEVKTRHTEYFGYPEKAVNKQKQRFLSEAAKDYLESKDFDYENRFDIISIILGNKETQIEHIEDAFYPFC